MHCFEENENLDHLILECKFSIIIWRKIRTWIGLDIEGDNFEGENNVRRSWCNFANFLKKSVVNGSEGVMWLAIIWNI